MEEKLSKKDFGSNGKLNKITGCQPDRKVKMNNKEEVYAVGFKGFDKDMKCRDKQYAEDTVFEEKGGDICNKGVMHFCEYPLDVFKYYPPVKNGKINTFASVKALAECQKKGDKFATTKIRIGAKIDFAGLAKAAIDFIFKRVKKEKIASTSGFKSVASTSGDWSVASTSGNESVASTSGFKSVASTSGFKSVASTSGNESLAVAFGINSKAKGAVGCYITCTEWDRDDKGEWHLKNVKTAKVDGKKIKADTLYMLKGGKFAEAQDEQ